MTEKKSYYVFINKDGNITAFHLFESTLIPVSNFQLALKWYKDKALMGTSHKEMELLLSDYAIRKRYEPLLDDEDKIVHLKIPQRGPFPEPRTS